MQVVTTNKSYQIHIYHYLICMKFNHIQTMTLIRFGTFKNHDPLAHLHVKFSYIGNRIKVMNTPT
jgi:hypothetical protein